jgi:VanZ family protein
MIFAFVYAVVALLMFIPMPHGRASPSVPHLDKVVHLVAWSMVSLGTWPVVRVMRWTWRLSVGRRFVVVVIFATVFGVTVELVQGLSAYRSADVWDAVADTVGAVLGALFCLWRERSRERRPSISAHGVH